MSSGGDGDRHREHIGVSQTKQAKKKKSRRPIEPKDIPGSIFSTPEHISHDTHLFVVPFRTADPRQYYPNYRRQALPPRCYEDLPLQVIRRARPLSISTPSPTSTSPQLSAMRIRDSSSEQIDAMAGMPPLTQHFLHLDVSPSSTARPSKGLDDIQIVVMSAQIAQLTSALAESERRRVVEQQIMSETVRQIKEQVMNLARRPTTSALEDIDDDSVEDDYVVPTP
ncbi:hypothetical protein H5410_027426 [Solanum commersonii]|uniref:Uncharacterized protein n=1 Tax=Solanum commersonii TaxID=4109 RepID=A0A9J5Z4F0_SOLCO|nr:hypothetical protein H5410_027426 [Solanum commersonii]